MVFAVGRVVHALMVAALLLMLVIRSVLASEWLVVWVGIASARVVAQDVYSK